MPRLVDRIRAAALDLDGTLIDTAPDLAAAANAMLELLGYSRLPEPRIARLIGNGIDRLVEGALAESAGERARPAAVAAAPKLFRLCYAERLFERSRVYPGVSEGLRALRALGIDLCCVTNKHSAFTLPLLEASGLARHFAFVLCADRPEERKPAPNLLNAARERFGIEAGELLFVGDSRIDVAAARAARCPVAIVDYGYNQGEPLGDADPDWIVGSLAEIAALPASKLLASAA
ncbi:MAG TPA: phosphoglycolate phosphatase [Casimicrobiaceae bacterium]